MRLTVLPVGNVQRVVAFAERNAEAFALIVFGATALISALGILIYRRICKRSEARQKEDQA